MGMDIVVGAREARVRRHRCFISSVCLAWKWLRSRKRFGPTLAVRLEKVIWSRIALGT